MAVKTEVYITKKEGVRVRFKLDYETLFHSRDFKWFDVLQLTPPWLKVRIYLVMIAAAFASGFFWKQIQFLEFDFHWVFQWELEAEQDGEVLGVVVFLSLVHISSRK